MSTFTPNYNLEKPDSTDSFSSFRESYNSNMDKIDGIGGGGSGDSVSWTQVQSSGTKIAEIDINGTSQNVYSPTPPTKTSDLTNDSGFITNTVSNLANYYLKSQTYTQAEVDALIGAIATISIEVVQTLPTQDIKTNTMYLVPKQSAGTQNVYDEYIYVNNAWELIGDTEIDLSNYVTASDLATALVDYITSTALTTILGNYVLTSALATVATSGRYSDLIGLPVIPTKTSDLTNDSGFSSTAWSQLQLSGTKIAEITINGTIQNVYSPSGGGGDDEIIDGMLKGRLGLDGLLIDDQGNYIKTDQDDLMKAHVIVLFDRME